MKENKQTRININISLVISFLKSQKLSLGDDSVSKVLATLAWGLESALSIHGKSWMQGMQVWFLSWRVGDGRVSEACWSASLLNGFSERLRLKIYCWRRQKLCLPPFPEFQWQSSESTKIHSREQISLLNLFIERWVALKQSHWTYLWLHRRRPLPLAFSCLHAQPCWSMSPPMVRTEWHTTSWEEWVATQAGVP